MQLESKTSTRYNLLDIIKFFLVPLVIFQHVMLYNAPISNFIRILGAAAVPIYFAISGFLVFSKENKNNYNGSYIKRYIMKTLIMYVFWCVIYFIPSSGLIFRATGATDVTGKFALTYLHYFFMYGAHTPLWYLTSVCVAILLAFVFRKLTKSPSAVVLIAILFYVVGALCDTYDFALEPLFGTVWTNDVLPFIKSIIITTRNGVFYGFVFVSIGMYAYECKLKMKKWTMAALLLASVVLLIFETQNSGCFYLTLLPIAFFTIFLITSADIPDKKMYSKIGRISGIMYLVHFGMYASAILSPVRTAFQKLIASCGKDVFNILYFLLIYVMTFAVSFALMKLAELKPLKWLNRLY